MVYGVNGKLMMYIYMAGHQSEILASMISQLQKYQSQISLSIPSQEFFVRLRSFEFTSMCEIARSSLQIVGDSDAAFV